MITVNRCKECEGEGTLKIFNAYDPEYEAEVACDYCEGSGLAINSTPEEAKKSVRDWVN